MRTCSSAPEVTAPDPTRSVGFFAVSSFSAAAAPWARWIALGTFLVEFIDWAPRDLFEEMPQCVDGHFRIPERPGHGMAFSADALKKYRST